MKTSECVALVSERVILKDGVREAAVLMQDGMIADVISRNEIPTGIQTEDFGNDVIMPGLIDAHVHINEPGRTDWEGFETATQAAAAGGVTTLMDMPLNSAPVTTSVSSLLKKIDASTGKRFVDCGFYGGLIPGNEHEIEPLIEAGITGVKAFLCHSGIDDFPNATEKELRAVMPILAKHDIPLLVHAELVDANAPEIHHPQKYQEYMRSRPEHWEVNAIKMMLNLCRETGCRVHIVHLAAASAIPILEQAKKEGLPVTVETAPHYLFFASENIQDADTRFKCAPPIRTESNRKLLWEGLISGLIDFVATDHSPSTLSLKELESGNLVKAWGGISSLQLFLPALWSAAKEEGCSLGDIARWTSKNPAAFLGLKNKGNIQKGMKADLVVWQPEERFRVDAHDLYHKNPCTPYDGYELSGRVKATWLDGVKVFDSQKVFGKPTGEIIKKSGV